MKDLESLLERSRTILALRFTVLTLAIFIAAAVLGLSTGIVSIVPAILLVLFLKDERFVAGFGLVAGVLFGGIVVLVLSRFLSQLPLLFLIACLSLIFVFSYTASQSQRGRMNMLPFSVAVLLCIACALFSEISGAESGVDAARIWLVELPVGTVLLWVILGGLWPAPSAADLDNLVHATRRECAVLLRKAIAPVRSGVATFFVPSRVSLVFLGDLTRTVNLNAAKFRNGPISHAHMIDRLESLAQIYTNIRYMQRAFEDLPQPGLSPEARTAAADIMAAYAERIEGGPGEDMTTELETIRHEEQRHAASAGKDLASLRIAARLSGFVVAANALDTSIAAYDRPQAAPAVLPVAPPAEKATPHLMVDSLQTAIKIVLGVMTGLVVFMISGLPASAYLVVAILIVLIQPNLGKAHLRFRLWFPGVVFGSLWAVLGIMVLSLLPYFAVYLVWLLPGLLLAGYLGVGPDRVAYVGIQIVAAMSVILGMAVYPADNVISAESRILGAVIGFMVSLSIYHVVWPAHPATLLRQNLCRNLRNLFEILSRISQVEADIRDPEKEAALSKQVAALKLEIQSNVGLLYDISYMLTARLRPAYDYRALCHQLGLIYMQIWCLEQALALMGDVERRQTILAPIAAAAEPLARLSEDLADRLELGRNASSAAMEQSMEAVRTQLATFRDEIASQSDPQRREDTQYGINAMGMMMYHLNIFADGMDFSERADPVRTAELQHLYEASKA